MSIRSIALTTTLLIFVSAAIMFVRLGETPVTRSSEERCYDVAKNMIESGNLVVPVYHGRTRLQKPPLYYWMSVASARLSGGLTNTSLRIPSALAAMLLLLTIAIWAHSIGGARLSFASVMALVSTLQFYRMGRDGTAEMTLALASTVALMLYEIGVRRRDQAPRPAVALATAVAFLAKATTALMTVALPIVVDLASRRRLRAMVRRPVVLWSLVALAIGAAWYVYIITAVPGAYEKLLGDITRPFGLDVGEGGGAEHYRAPWYFFDKLFAAALPACLLIPVAVFAAIRTRFQRDNPALRFVLLTFVTLFVAFSILPQKQKHYALQMLPALSILLGDAALRCCAAGRTKLIGRLRPFGVLIAVSGLVFVCLLGWLFHVLPRAGSWIVVPLTGAGACFVLAGIAAVRAGPRTFLLTFSVAWLGVSWGYFTELRPWMKQIDYAAENETAYPDEERLLRVAQEHPRMMNLLGVDEDIEDLREAAASRKD